MEKQKLSITKKPPITFEYRNCNVVMDTFISPIQQSMIVHEYLGTLYKDENMTDNFLLSEWQLILSVTDKMTNIPIMEESDNTGLEDLITSGLWNEIKSKIINYDELLETIDVAVERVETENALKKSMGQVIDNLSQKAESLFYKISQIDFSEKGVQELVKTLQTETAKFEQTVLAKEPVETPKPTSPRRKHNVSPA